jgi:hypothetical protein
MYYCITLKLSWAYPNLIKKKSNLSLYHSIKLWVYFAIKIIMKSYYWPGPGIFSPPFPISLLFYFGNLTDECFYSTLSGLLNPYFWISSTYIKLLHCPGPGTSNFGGILSFKIKDWCNLPILYEPPLENRD